MHTQVGYFVSLNTDRIGDLCGDSLAKLQGGGNPSRSSHALGIVSLGPRTWHKRSTDSAVLVVLYVA
jgi:hypothetical protein